MDRRVDALGAGWRSRVAGVAAALLACAAGMAVAHALAAQDVRPALSLSEALDLASQHNPAYRRALNDMTLAAPQRREAWGAFLPSLNVSGGTAYGFNEQAVGTDDFGNPVANPEVRRLWSSGSNQTFGFDVPLFEGGARFSRLGEARARADVTTWAARAALADAEAEIKRQFFQARFRENRLDLEQELLQARRDDLMATQRLFEIAARSQSDLLGAELEVQRQERQLDSERAERDKAMVALRAAIGDPSLAITGLAEEPFQPLDPSRLTVDAVVTAAMSQQPEVHQRMAEIDQANALVSVARAGRWPTLSLTGGYSRAASGLSTQFLFDFSPDISKYGQLGLQVSIPLFQRFSTSARIAEAEVSRDNATETLRETRLNTERDVLQALIDLETRFNALELQATERDVAERRLALVREEYRLAVKNFAELQQAIRDAADARRQEVQARYDYMDAWITLEQRVGGPVSASGGTLEEPN